MEVLLAGCPHPVKLVNPRPHSRCTSGGASRHGSGSVKLVNPRPHSPSPQALVEFWLGLRPVGPCVTGVGNNITIHSPDSNCHVGASRTDLCGVIGNETRNVLILGHLCPGRSSECRLGRSRHHVRVEAHLLYNPVCQITSSEHNVWSDLACILAFPYLSSQNRTV